MGNLRFDGQTTVGEDLSIVGYNLSIVCDNPNAIVFGRIELGPCRLSKAPPTFVGINSSMLEFVATSHELPRWQAPPPSVPKRPQAVVTSKDGRR